MRIYDVLELRSKSLTGSRIFDFFFHYLFRFYDTVIRLAELLGIFRSGLGNWKSNIVWMNRVIVVGFEYSTC